MMMAVTSIEFQALQWEKLSLDCILLKVQIYFLNPFVLLFKVLLFRYIYLANMKE